MSRRNNIETLCYEEGYNVGILGLDYANPYPLKSTNYYHYDAGYLNGWEDNLEDTFGHYEMEDASNFLKND